MKQPLIPLKNINIAYFYGCDNCSKCCDGSQFLFAPIFLSDIKEIYRYFPIVFAKIGTHLRLVYILSDGKPCKYLHNGICSIYHHRPHACKTYPLTLFQNQIALDISCPAVGSLGVPIATDSAYDSRFFHPRFKNWKTKQQQTQRFINVQKGYKKLGKVNEYTIYEGVGSTIYHQMIKKSLSGGFPAKS